MDIRKWFTLVINSIITVDVIVIAMIGIVCGAGEGQPGNYIIGLGYFKPYTMDSNILTGFAAFLVVVYCLKHLHNDRKRFPRWLMRTYLMGTTSLLLTFLIAAAFLAPIQVMSGRSYLVMFSGEMLFFHFLNPLLAAISLTVLMKDTGFSLVDRLIGMIPTIVYSIVYFVMVVVLKRWDDFYHFTFGGKYYLIPGVIIIIYGITYMSAYLLTRIHNYFVKSFSDKG